MIPLPVIHSLPFRRCPVPGCTRQIANGHCMCLQDWRLVSPGAREIEMATFEAWCRGKVDDATYEDALDGAIRSALRRMYERDLPVPKSGRPGFPMRSAKRVGNKPSAPAAVRSLTGADGCRCR